MAHQLGRYINKLYFMSWIIKYFKRVACAFCHASQAARRFNLIYKIPLIFGRPPSRSLDLDRNKYGYPIPYHIRRNGKDTPAD